VDTTWRDTVDRMVTALAAVGIRATADPRSLNPPGALIAPPDLAWTRSAGTPDAVWRVHLIAGGPNDLDAAAWLLDRVADAAAAVGAVQADYVSLTIDPNADPVPAYTLTVPYLPY
jgi:hypothetical protein